MLRIRNLILINALYVMACFVVGVIHPNAVLSFRVFEIFVPLVGTVLLVISIIEFIRNLFKPNKMIIDGLLKVFLCWVFVLIFGFSLYISFVGLRIHYWFVKDYDTIRSWANNVEIPEEGYLLSMNFMDIPEPAKAFHPENVDLRKEDGVRILRLSWDSGLMGVSWILIICPVDYIYQVERGLFVEIQPGVYLYFRAGP